MYNIVHFVIDFPPDGRLHDLQVHKSFKALGVSMTSSSVAVCGTTQGGDFEKRKYASVIGSGSLFDPPDGKEWQYVGETPETHPAVTIRVFQAVDMV